MLILWLKNELSAVQSQYESVQKEETELREIRAKSGELEDRLIALYRLATNRFMWAPVLDELQNCMIDGVYLTQLETTQSIDASAIAS